jgi:Tol biopolymer transport system component
MPSQNPNRPLHAPLLILASSLLLAFASTSFRPPALAQSNTLAGPSSSAVRFVYYRTRTLALAMDAPEYKNIYSMTSEGGAEIQLTEDNHSFNPVLSSDGSKIAYLHIKADTCEGCLMPAEYEIYVMNVDGTDAHIVASLDKPMAIAWSPDSRALAYGGFPIVSNTLSRAQPSLWLQSDVGDSRALDSPLYLLQLDGASQPRLLAEKTTGALKWSPDGKWIAYACLSSQESAQRGFHLCLSGMGQKTELRILPESGVLPDNYSWSPDGTQLAYSAFDGTRCSLSIVEMDGSAPIPSIASTGCFVTPQWSPNGRQIVFTGIEGNNSLVYAMNADGSGRTRLIGPKLRVSNPMWSPDGKRIVFTAIVSGNPQVHLMNADGSQLRILTHDRNLDCSNVAWFGEINLLLIHCKGPAESRNAGVSGAANGHFLLLAPDDPAGRPRQLIDGGAIGISFAPVKPVQNRQSNSSWLSPN